MAEGYCEIAFRLFLGLVRTVRDLEDAHCMSYRTGGALQDAHFVRYRTPRCACWRMLAGRADDIPPPFHFADATLLFIV